MSEKRKFKVEDKVENKTVREGILEEAITLSVGDRQDSYGSPKDSFNRIAKLWSAVLGQDLTAAQVAQCLALLKISRLTGNTSHRDSWVDLAAYAALGAEVSDD